MVLFLSSLIGSLLHVLDYVFKIRETRIDKRTLCSTFPEIYVFGFGTQCGAFIKIKCQGFNPRSFMAKLKKRRFSIPELFFHESR